MAFWVPLQTNNFLPFGVNVSALGWAPNKSAGFWRIQMVSTILSVRVSSTLSVSLPVLATTSQRPLGETAMAVACKPVRISAWAFPAGA